MGAPPQGMGGPTNEDREHEQRHHAEVMRLTKVSIIIAIAIGIPVIYLGIQTGFVLDEIRSINTRQLEIENFEPIFDIEGSYINFLGSGFPKYELNDGITFTAVTNHYLKFTVTNVTISYLNQNFAPCYFKSGPEFSLWRTSSIVLSPNGESKQIEPELQINFEAFGNFRTQMNEDEGILFDLGSIIFDIHVEDIQDENKQYDLQTYTDLVVLIPPRLYDTIQNCETLPENT